MHGLKKTFTPKALASGFAGVPLHPKGDPKDLLRIIPGPGILTYMGPPGPGILTYMSPPGPGILTYMGPPGPGVGGWGWEVGWG